MTASPAAVSAASLHNTITFTYTAGAGGISAGAVTLTVPSNWSAPSLTATSAGFTTADAGTLTISSRTITVSNLTLGGSGILTITYGVPSPGPGATAPPSPILQTWTTKEKSTAGGTLANLAAQPQVQVTARDGAGTVTASPTTAVAGSTNNTITFTYTAPTGGLIDGAVTILVPNGWTPPQTDHSGDPGYVVTDPTVSVDIAGQYITAFGFNMNAGDHLAITYGQNNGATAPSNTGPQTWQAQEYSSPGGIPTNLAASPTITVISDSTMVVDPDAVSASSTHNEMAFTYTAPTGGLTNGAVTLTVPTGWSAPSVTTTAAGYTTASAGTLTVALRTITVSGLTLAGGGTLTINYGDRTFGGPGATAPSSPIVQTWPTMEAPTGGTLIPAASPTVTVTAKDGTGTITTTTKNVSANSTGNTIVFTFKAPAGGVTHGEVAIAAPNGWTPPSTTQGDPGYFTFAGGTGGTRFTDVQRMGVLDFTLPAGQTLTITYGDKTGGGPGATASSTTGAQTWQAAERSSLAISGAMKNLSTSPSIIQNAPDGAGTLAFTSPTPDPDPSSAHLTAVRASSHNNTFVFTFKAPVGGMVNGTVTLTVPADWPAPSTDTAQPGFSKTNSTSLPLSASGQTITVPNVTKSAGSTFTITYGFKTAGGGQGVDAPIAPGSDPWQAQERSTPAGTLTNLTTSPSTLIPTHNIEANGSHGCNGTLGGGSGTFCFMPNSTTASVGGTVTFANFTGSTHDVDRCTPDVCNGVGPGTGGDPTFGGSPDLHPGFQYSVTFNGAPGSEAGTYNYRCSIHGYAVMHGTITVS